MRFLYDFHHILPPGHIAGAYLTTSAVLAITHPAVSPEQLVILMVLGIFFGFAPDLDFFYGFAKAKTWTATEQEFNHRRFLSHAPVLWLFAGIMIYLIGPDPFWKEVGILLWVGSWTHFALDSIESGVMWLWPFQKTQFALLPIRKKYLTSEKRFIPFWAGFVNWYTRDLVSSKLEFVLIVFACFFIFFA